MVRIWACRAPIDISTAMSLYLVSTTMVRVIRILRAATRIIRPMVTAVTARSIFSACRSCAFCSSQLVEYTRPGDPLGFLRNFGRQIKIVQAKLNCVHDIAGR